MSRFEHRPPSSCLLTAAVPAGLALAVCFVVPLSGQQAAPAPPARQAAAIRIDEATTLTQGWAFLAQGDVGRAAEKAAAALATSPRSGAAFALALEVAVARAGARAGLEAYESWIGSRSDDPVFLRRVAIAVLQELAAGADPMAEVEALEALYSSGDSTAGSKLTDGVRQGRIAETRVLAARGDALAVRQLAKALGGTISNPIGAIQALGASGSAEAVPSLLQRLDDSRSEVRGAAAEALGRTGGPGVVPRLVPLLEDRSGHVRFKAAGALYRLGDFRGTPLLEELKKSESAVTRLAVVEALESRPDEEWEMMVRALTEAPEPEVRLRAAALASRFDPALAQQTLQALSGQPNTAIGQEASRVMALEAGLDLAGLRRLLRHADSLTRVASASSILRQTQ